MGLLFCPRTACDLVIVDSEHLVCALRSWHQLDSPKNIYRLWNYESAWTSDALAVGLVADWDDEASDEDEVGRDWSACLRGRSPAVGQISSDGKTRYAGQCEHIVWSLVG
ncbi:MAG: hypothetical protein ACYDD4_09355 [Acidimicrobiales bacterium]